MSQISTPAPFSAKAATAACCFAVTDGGYAAAVAISGASGCQLLRSADSAIGCALQLAATAIIVCGGLSRPRDEELSLRGQRVPQRKAARESSAIRIRCLFRCIWQSARRHIHVPGSLSPTSCYLDPPAAPRQVLVDRLSGRCSNGVGDRAAASAARGFTLATRISSLVSLVQHEINAPGLRS